MEMYRAWRLEMWVFSLSSTYNDDIGLGVFRLLSELLLNANV